MKEADQKVNVLDVETISPYQYHNKYTRAERRIFILILVLKG